MTKSAQDIHPNQLLSEIVSFRTYAKYLPHIGRRESLAETINRNMNMHLDRFPKLSKDIVKAYQKVHDLKVMPSMRALQFSGDAILKNHARQYNCSFVNINSERAFGEALFLLLSGVGVGFSVQKRHVSSLPKITIPKEEGFFVVQDSIMGWAQAVDLLFDAYMLGRVRPQYDFGNIRPKGSYLVTTGAKAPGPEPLKKMLELVEGKLKAAVGRKLSPLEVHDIICIISDSVLAGGIRRAALISLFDRDDTEMLTCKHGEWWNSAPWRARANNSAVLPRSEVTQEEFYYIFEMCQKSGSGEPGFYWTSDLDLGTNPCCEISLNSNQFCVSEDTSLITKTGIQKIGQAVGKKIEVWNGEKWAECSPFKTQEGVDLYRVVFSDGSYLDCTDNHKFLVKKNHQKHYQELTTARIKAKIELESSYFRNKFSVPRSNINDFSYGVDEEYAYEYGYFKGDGHLSQTGNPHVCVYDKKDADLNLRYKVIARGMVNVYGTEYFEASFIGLDKEFCKQLKQELPDKVFTWSKKSILQFVAGLADADGSAASKGIRIYGKENCMRKLQLLLTKVGINSSVNLMQKKGIKTNLGVRKNDVWYVQITKTHEIPSRRLPTTNKQDCRYKGKNQLIDRIIKLPGKHTVYCLEEKDLHQCVFNNVLTKQCNLTTINQTGVTSEKDFLNRVYAAALIGTLQASYTDFNYLRPEWKSTTEKEALLGVSFTGIADSGGVVTPELLAKGAKLVLEVNEKYAKKIGINLAARTTAIKPEGTSSCVLGSSSGIHARHAPYYIRRIRMNKDDALAVYLKTAIPDLVEDDKFSSSGVVVSISQESPAGAITRHDETALSLLDRALMYRSEWVENGYRSGANHHNVSVTISVKDHEWDVLKHQMWINRHRYSGISLLPYDGGTYVQAPFEDCTKENFEDMSKLVKEIDLRLVKEENDNTNRIEQLACVGGNCEIT